ncbi:GNAT family acetyltransferase [bacterium]|nr:GNAT family acetyltransferase [bacterium]
MSATVQIRVATPEDTEAIVSLWERCGLTRPWNDPRKDIARKSKVNPELFLVAESGGQIIGTVMAGYEGHRGWINYLGVDPAHQRQGVGRQLMAAAEDKLQASGCPKINLQVRSTNAAVIDFYRALGYGIDEVASLGKRLEQDGPTAG